MSSLRSFDDLCAILNSAREEFILEYTYIGQKFPVNRFLVKNSRYSLVAVDKGIVYFSRTRGYATLHPKILCQWLKPGPSGNAWYHYDTITVESLLEYKYLPDEVKDFILFNLDLFR